MAGMRGNYRRSALCALAMALAVFFAIGRVHAAGTAYAVDTAEVGERGNCKVEAWTSWANNRDALGTISPACVVASLPRLELSTELTRARADGGSFSAVSPKAKINLLPTSIGGIGFALVGGASYDTTLGDTTSVFAYVPATLRLSDVVRVNVVAGWSLDRMADRHFATYGLGLDWLFAPKFSMTLETFGQFSGQDVGAETRPRFQAGLRYRPVDRFSTDLIVGRNINGEGSSWITLSSTIRFNVP